MRAVVYPGAAAGAVRLPSSKSVAHRALLAAALAKGETVLEGLDRSEDLRATANAARLFGAEVKWLPGGRIRLRGCGFPCAPARPVDCGESGSTLRFLIPLLALTGEQVTLTGRGRLPERPQEVYAALFAERGLPFGRSTQGLSFRGPLGAGEYRLSGAVSSQFITGLLLALPLLDGDSSLQITPPFESRPYVELTRSVLARFGVYSDWSGPLSLTIPGTQRYQPVGRFEVEGDFSQAAFFAALGALSGEVLCENLSTDSAQGDRVIFDQLRHLGASVTQTAAGLLVRRAPLQAGVFDLGDCPDLGPILMTLCCFAGGESVLLRAGRLRLKESDRITAMQTELAKLGLRVESRGDEIHVQGIGDRRCSAPDRPLSGWNDHRIVMSLAVAAARADGPVPIEGAQAVGKSYPHFFDDLSRVGIRVDLI